MCAAQTERMLPEIPVEAVEADRVQGVFSQGLDVGVPGRRGSKVPPQAEMRKPGVVWGLKCCNKLDLTCKTPEGRRQVGRCLQDCDSGCSHPSGSRQQGLVV